MEDDVKGVLVALGVKITPENVTTLRRFGMRQWSAGYDEGMLEERNQNDA
jgi:hypothetical protein